MDGEFEDEDQYIGFWAFRSRHAYSSRLPTPDFCRRPLVEVDVRHPHTGRRGVALHMPALYTEVVAPSNEAYLKLEPLRIAEVDIVLECCIDAHDGQR